jgi:hypothetical protein
MPEYLYVTLNVSEAPPDPSDRAAQVTLASVREVPLALMHAAWIASREVETSAHTDIDRVMQAVAEAWSD